MKLLLDTNVIIDYLGRKPPFFESAEKVIAAGYFEDAQLWASTQSFKDAFYVLSHYVDSHRVQSAMEPLLKIVNPVDLTGKDIESAIRLDWDDFEDCLIAISAQKAEADFLLTRDAKGFEKSMVPTRTPDEWLGFVEETQNITYAAIDLD